MERRGGGWEIKGRIWSSDRGGSGEVWGFLRKGRGRKCMERSGGGY